MIQNKSFDIVCFDCDSTLSRIEGIDELAKYSGVAEQVKHLTQIAMDGELPLESVYERRLSLICPDRQAIAMLADLYIEEMVDGAADVCTVLQQQGKQVHIISGGIRQAILPLAEQLHLPLENVHAVDIYFDADGNYRGYDTDSPLARSGGKAEICRRLNINRHSLVLIGDGQTDLESKQSGAYFIGFGGVVERSAIREQADVYVNASSLQAVIPYIIRS